MNEHITYHDFPDPQPTSVDEAIARGGVAYKGYWFAWDFSKIIPTVKVRYQAPRQHHDHTYSPSYLAFLTMLNKKEEGKKDAPENDIFSYVYVESDDALPKRSRHAPTLWEDD